MRQLSKRTEYSLRALYALARNYGGGPMLITHLAGEEAIVKKFLEQILLSLETLGLFASKKGKGGGYRLAQPPGQITLATVIRMMEGPLAPLPSASETHFGKCDECPDVETCGARLCARSATPWPGFWNAPPSPPLSAGPSRCSRKSAGLTRSSTTFKARYPE